MWRILLLAFPLSALVYTLWHIWWLLPLPVAWRSTIVTLCALSFFLLFLSVAKVLDFMPIPAATIVYKTGTTSLIVLLYTTIIFLFLDLLRFVQIIPPQTLRNNILITTVMTAVLAAVFIYGNIRYHHKARRELTLHTEKYIGQKVKLLLLSDLHLGYHIRCSELRQWVDMINKENPDIVLLAGDLIDRSVKPLLKENMAAEMRKINAPVYACLGNHEYYCDLQQAMAFYKNAGIILLRDSVAMWNGIYIAGRDDRTNQQRKSVAALLKDINKDSYIILLDHQPYDIERSAKAGADFQFSGHTHHGQVFPASLITDAVYTVAYGKYSIGGTQYYVSSGLGIWGGKFRIGTCSEYVVATIESK